MEKSNVAIVQALFGIFVLRCIFLYSYRLFFHPLRLYPGPFIAKISDWYGAYCARQRRLHWATYEDHVKYGPVVRHGPNKLVFNTTQAVHDIYHNERLLKSKSYLVTQISPNVYNAFTTLDKQRHRIRRRIIGQGLNEKATRHFSPVLNSEVTIFLQQLRNLAAEDQAVDMSKRCHWLTLDVSGQLGFGRSFDLQVDPKNRFIPQAMTTSLWLCNIHIQFPAIKSTGWQTLLLPVLLPKIIRLQNLISGMIQSRLSQAKEARPDLLALVSGYKDPETGQTLSEEDIWAESSFLLTAAGDTVSALLTATFFYLSRYPNVYQRLATEIRTTFTDAGDIKHGSKLSGCSYLRACLEESLRISPPSATTLWRDLPTDAGVSPIIIDGNLIPPGTMVGVNIHAIHHNEAYFPAPFTFKPERWLPKESGLDNEQTKMMQNAFLPFAKGSRHCPGTALAYAEASLVIAKTLWFFDFERHDTDTKSAEKGMLNIFHMEDIVGSCHTGPLLRLHYRVGSGEVI